MIYEKKLLKQFNKWAKSLMKVNPDYVTDPERLLPYLRGPNWDDPDVEYAHYRDVVSSYGQELLDKFEWLRSASIEEAKAEYRRLLKVAGIEESTD